MHSHSVHIYNARSRSGGAQSSVVETDCSRLEDHEEGPQHQTDDECEARCDDLQSSRLLQSWSGPLREESRTRTHSSHSYPFCNSSQHMWPASQQVPRAGTRCANYTWRTRAHHLRDGDLFPPGLSAHRVLLHVWRHASGLDEGARAGAGAEGVGGPCRRLGCPSKGAHRWPRRSPLLACDTGHPMRK